MNMPTMTARMEARAKRAGEASMMLSSVFMPIRLTRILSS